MLTEIQRQADAGDLSSKLTFFNAVAWCVSERAAQRDLQIAAMRGAIVDPQQVSKAVERLKPCSSVSWDLSSKRFSYLHDVAAQGDADAQIAYVRALFALPREDPSWVLAHADELQVMQREAMLFLAQAAQGGSREAMDRLADIYRYGRFGQKDDAMASMYEHMAKGAP